MREFADEVVLVRDRVVGEEVRVGEPHVQDVGDGGGENVRIPGD